MGTYFIGHRTFYEENGRLFDSVKKAIEYDMKTLEQVVSNKTTTAVTTKQDTVTTVNLQCPICKFKAPFEEALESHMKTHQWVKK